MLATVTDFSLPLFRMGTEREHVIQGQMWILFRSGNGQKKNNLPLNWAKRFKFMLLPGAVIGMVSEPKISTAHCQKTAGMSCIVVIKSP